jgi:hypothetical protein
MDSGKRAVREIYDRGGYCGTSGVFAYLEDEPLPPPYGRIESLERDLVRLWSYKCTNETMSAFWIVQQDRGRNEVYDRARTT